MNLQEEINYLLKKYDLRARKRFGQNFLIDESVLDKTIAAANIKNKDVIEIGPGLGSLTKKILKVCKSLLAFEIDRDICHVIKEEIKDDKLTLIEGDFLKSDIDWKDKKTLVANLPYYITSDILFKLFANINQFENAFIMIQNEVANRLCAKVGSKEYGKLSVTANYFATINKEFIVKPGSFNPQPKVTSSIVSLTFNKAQEISPEKFVPFIRDCFFARRKTLNNNLKRNFEISQIKKAFTNLNFQDSIRPQELSLHNFIDLYKNLM